jgi:hypothetical protein
VHSSAISRGPADWDEGALVIENPTVDMAPAADPSLLNMVFGLLRDLGIFAVATVVFGWIARSAIQQYFDKKLQGFQSGLDRELQAYQSRLDKIKGYCGSGSIRPPSVDSGHCGTQWSHGATIGSCLHRRSTVGSGPAIAGLIQQNPAGYTPLRSVPLLARSAPGRCVSPPFGRVDPSRRDACTAG